MDLQAFTTLALGQRTSGLALLERHLGDAALPVIRAATVEEALTSIEREAIELVVIDVDRDDDLGLGFCRALKNDPARVDLPVVGITERPNARRAAWEAGLDELFAHLVHRDELLARLHALVRLGRVRRMHTADQLAEEVRRREEIRSTFRRYVSPQLADEILARPDLPVSKLERPSRMARASVLFADMRGFTRIAERLDPDSVVRILNEYFALLTEITFRHDGTVFNMAGDCLMVGFGVPLEQPDLGLRAIQTGAEILARFGDLASGWRAQYGIETGVGIGINLGEVIAGNVGCSSYMSYTIIGDTVNVASRLAQRARAGEMLFSQSVLQSLSGTSFANQVHTLPALTLRGRSAPLDIHCIPCTERIDLRRAGGAAA
ncbi:MAG TPA: adenylate/guanylate cyclase domain-containing protein [Steroidobacteraceae bacterium]|nr:adenylate/guanylate cyclase domain-containing protein [Steroidobacteraceae bacterium]